MSYVLGHIQHPTPKFELSRVELSWYIIYVITNLGLGLCGLSRWVNFRVTWADVFLALFHVGLQIALGFGCLFLIYWIWIGLFSWLGPKLMGLCLWIGLSFEFVWNCMGLWELILIDEVVLSTVCFQFALWNLTIPLQPEWPYHYQLVLFHNNESLFYFVFYISSFI